MSQSAWRVIAVNGPYSGTIQFTVADGPRRQLAYLGRDGKLELVRDNVLLTADSKAVKLAVHDYVFHKLLDIEVP